MSSDITELYQRRILDHSKAPQNTALPEPASVRLDGHNPLCGDRLTLAVRVDGETISAIGCQALGCAISVAAGSLMTQAVQGRRVDEVKALFARYRAMVKSGAGEGLGDLDVFSSVAKFPSRRRCATLAWETLVQALDRHAAAEADSTS